MTAAAPPLVSPLRPLRGSGTVRHDANVALVDFVAYDGEQLYAAQPRFSRAPGGREALERRSGHDASR